MKQLPWKIIGLATGVAIIAALVAFFVTGGFHPTGTYQSLMRTDAQQDGFEACQKSLQRLDLIIVALEGNKNNFTGFEKEAGTIRQQHWDDIEAWRKIQSTVFDQLREDDRTYIQDELDLRRSQINTLIETFADQKLIEEHRQFNQKVDSEAYATSVTEEEATADQEKMHELDEKLDAQRRHLDHIRHEISTL